MRHLKKYEWIRIFEAYENYKSYRITKLEFDNICFDIRGKNWNFSSLKRMKKKLKMYNLNMNIESKTGKAPKKGKGVGRKSKKPIDYTWIDTLTEEEKSAVIKYYHRVFKEQDIDVDISNIKEINKLSSTKKSKALCMARSTYYEKKKTISSPKTRIVKDEKIIIDSFVENKQRYGRRRLSLFILNKFNIYIEPRTLGNRMKKLELKTFVRQKKRKREEKNTNVKFEDLVKRDYNSPDKNIYATDVTYIPAPRDVNQNHIYLSAIINHKTKFVTFEISKYNDLNLVMKNIDNTNFKKDFILHSDHGSAYSSHGYLNKIKSLNGRVSMSRIGNSLDNREIEYFFSILKSEIFPNFDESCRKMTFKELTNKINEFVNWYNNERIRL